MRNVNQYQPISPSYAEPQAIEAVRSVKFEVSDCFTQKGFATNPLPKTIFAEVHFGDPQWGTSSESLEVDRLMVGAVDMTTEEVAMIDAIKRKETLRYYKRKIMRLINPKEWHFKVHFPTRPDTGPW